MTQGLKKKIKVMHLNQVSRETEYSAKKKSIITYTEGWNNTSFRFILHVTPSELKKNNKDE